MSHTESTLIRCNLNGELTVERRIATALGNERERERMIAVKAHEIFCSRGFEHGFDLDDWLNAERELSPEASDVVITPAEAGFDVSIAGRSEQVCIALSIAPSSLLILWTADQPNSGEPNSRSTLSLASLPGPVEPEKREVTYCDGRVSLHLPLVGTALPPLEALPERNGGRRCAAQIKPNR
jgi:hypothetical protein